MVALAAAAPKRARRIRGWGRLAACGLRTAGPYEAYSAVSSRFDNRRERLVLEAAGITMPEPRTYLETIGSYAIGTDFGRSPIVTAVTVNPGADPVVEPEPSRVIGPAGTSVTDRSPAVAMIDSAASIMRSIPPAVPAPVAS
jgi:hypothetical protein